MKKINLNKLQYSKSQDIVGGTANLPTPAQPPVTLGAQPSPSASVPPPPPLPQSSPLLPPSSGLKSRLPAVNDHKALLLESIRNTSGRPLKKYSGEFTSKGPINNIDRQPQGFTDELKIRFKSSGNNTEQESREDFAKRIEMDLEKRKKEKVLEAKKKAPLLNHKMLQAEDIQPSNSDSGSGWTTDEGEQKEAEQKKRN